MTVFRKRFRDLDIFRVRLIIGVGYKWFRQTYVLIRSIDWVDLVLMHLKSNIQSTLSNC